MLPLGALPLIFVICASTTVIAKDEGGLAIDKFYPSTVERQALESDSQQVQTIVKPDAPLSFGTKPTKKSSSYTSFGDRKIKSKGIVLDESSQPSKPEESRRIEELQRPEDNLHEPAVHESEPIDFVVTEMVNRHRFTTQSPPVTQRHNWYYPSSNPSPYPTSNPQHRRSSSSSGRSSSRSSQRSSSSYSSPPVQSYDTTYTFPASRPASPSPKPYGWSSGKEGEEEVKEERSGKSSGKQHQEDNEPMPSIPEPTMPESTLKVKEGQAAARQYFYNSRWVPKSYSQQPIEKKQSYGPTGYGQETQQFNKVAERGDDMLLVFAHSSKSHSCTLRSLSHALTQIFQASERTLY